MRLHRSVRSHRLLISSVLLGALGVAYFSFAGALRGPYDRVAAHATIGQVWTLGAEVRNTGSAPITIRRVTVDGFTDEEVLAIVGYVGPEGYLSASGIGRVDGWPSPPGQAVAGLKIAPHQPGLLNFVFRPTRPGQVTAQHIVVDYTYRGLPYRFIGAWGGYLCVQPADGPPIDC